MTWMVMIMRPMLVGMFMVMKILVSSVRMLMAVCVRMPVAVRHIPM
jgi:hypothetical protein